MKTDGDGDCCAKSVRCNCNEIGSHVVRIADRGRASSKTLMESDNDHKKVSQMPPLYNVNTTSAPVPATAAMIVDTDKLVQLLALLDTDNTLLLPVATNPSCVVNPAVTLRRSCVGSMFGVVETWNCGATGVPSNWKRCSLKPVVVSWNICQLR